MVIDSRIKAFLTHPRLYFVLGGVTLVIYVLQFIVNGWLMEKSYIYGAQDQALYLRTLWEVGHFLPASEMVEPNLVPVSNWFLGAHFMPIAYLYGFLFQFPDVILTAIVLEAFSYGVTAYILCRAAEHVLHSQLLSLGILLTYLIVYAPVPGNFYFENLATPWAALALWLIVRSQFRKATIPLLVFVMFKEYLALVAAALGLALWWKTKSRMPLLWTLAGITWFVLAFLVIMPLIEPRFENAIMFSGLGSTTKELTLNLVQHPELLIERIARTDYVEYILKILLPTALLPLVGLEYIFAISPVLLINALPDNGAAVIGNVNQNHYTIMVYPFVIVGALIGLDRLRRWTVLLRQKRMKYAAWAVILLLVLVAMSEGLRYQVFRFRRTITANHIWTLHSKDVEAILTQIPPESSVASGVWLLPHLATQSEIVPVENLSYIYPEFIIVDSYFDSNRRWIYLSELMAKSWIALEITPTEDYNSDIYRTLSDVPSRWGGYCLVSSVGSITLLRRQGDCESR